MLGWQCRQCHRGRHVREAAVGGARLAGGVAGAGARWINQRVTAAQIRLEHACHRTIHDALRDLCVTAGAAAIERHLVVAPAVDRHVVATPVGQAILADLVGQKLEQLAHRPQHGLRFGRLFAQAPASAR